MTEEVETPQEPQYTEVEQQAMDKGWRPKEEFDADPKNQGKKWRTAEEFMDRQSLFDKIDDQHRRLKDMEKGLRSMAEYNQLIEKKAYEKAIRDLKAQKRAALEEQDLVKADEIDDQIDLVKEQARNAQARQPVQTDVAPELQAWMRDNPWYNQDPELHDFADFTATQLAQRGITGKDMLDQIVERVKKTYPTKFRNPNKNGAVPMEKGTAPNKVTEDERLSPEEERMIQNMVRAGVPKFDDKGKQIGNMTAAEYRAELKKYKGAN